MKVPPSHLLAQGMAFLPLLATTQAFLLKPTSAVITVPAARVAPARCSHIAFQRPEYQNAPWKPRRSSLTRLSVHTPEPSGPLDPPLQPRKFNMRAVLTLLIGELVIGALGLPLGKYFGVDPFATLLTIPTADSVLKGALLTLPLLGFHFLSGREIDAMLKEGLKEVFGDKLGLGWLLFLSVLLSASAGIGEEILFRGALQPILAAKVGPLAGIGISSLFFGMLHAATPRYFLLAAILSVYLGYIQYQYSCLLIPIVIHTLFDVIGFVKHTMLTSTSVLARQLTRRRKA